MVMSERKQALKLFVQLTASGDSRISAVVKVMLAGTITDVAKGSAAEVTPPVPVNRLPPPFCTADLTSVGVEVPSITSAAVHSAIELSTGDVAPPVVSA